MKQAIVTGAAVRVGKAISLALAQEGYDIIMIYNSSERQANETAAEIGKLGRKAHLYKCDLSAYENINKTFAFISKDHKKIRLLVNNASIFENIEFADTTPHVLSRHMDINLKAPFYLSQMFEQYVQDHSIKGANIVNILDCKVFKKNIGHFAYFLSKRGLLDLTKMTARALAPNVRVNSVSPGHLIDGKNDNPGYPDKEAKNMPMQTLPSLNSLTDAINYLDRSEYLTGQNIFVDSGANLT